MRACILLIASTLVLATPAKASPDPLENANRQVHALNEAAQEHVLRPFARLYRNHTSEGFRTALGRAFDNLGEPITAASALIAGALPEARNAAARFAINTTLGLGGIRDEATAMGYPHRPMSLADALCRWGVPSGPYLVLPLLGPSNLRDAAALAVASAALTQGLGDAWLALGTSERLHSYTTIEPTLGRLEAGSLDPYATFRSAYRQRRVQACPQDAAEPEAE